MTHARAFTRNFFYCLFLFVLAANHGHASEQRVDPFTAINDDFRADYKRVQEQYQARLGDSNHPVVHIFGDQLILMADGSRREFALVPKTYHQIKAIAHVPFSIYLSLLAASDSLTNEKRVKIGLVQNALSETELSAAALKTCNLVLKKSADFLDRYLTSKRKPTQSEWQGYLASIRDPLRQLFFETASLRISTLHSRMQEITKELGPVKSKALRVVISGSHQARAREVAVQYFEKIFKEKQLEGAFGESKLLYGEGLWDPKDALRLVATHEVDQDAAMVFWGNKKALQKDVLSDGAARALQKIKP